MLNERNEFTNTVWGVYEMRMSANIDTKHGVCVCNGFIFHVKLRLASTVELYPGLFYVARPIKNQCAPSFSTLNN